MLPDGRPPIDSSNAPIPLLMFAIFFSTPGTVSVDPACSGTGPGTLAGILLGRVLIVPLEPLVPLPLPLGILGCYLSRLLRSSCYRRLLPFLPLSREVQLRGISLVERSGRLFGRRILAESQRRVLMLLVVRLVF